MKRLLGVVLVLFMACIPMNIHAKEVDLSFEYSAQKVEIQNAIKYYTIEGELLDEALHMTEKWCACSAPSVYL